jgi:hypothetical protein
MKRAERIAARTRRRELAAEAINGWAMAEGWAIFNAEDRPEIQTDDDNPKHATDADAIAHVRRLANAGSALHRAALKICREDRS